MKLGGLLWGCAALVALGFFLPGEFVSALNWGPRPEFEMAFVLVLLTPVMPLAIVVLSHLGARLPEILRAILIGVVLLAGLLVWLAITVFSGPGMTHASIGFAAVLAGLIGALQTVQARKTTGHVPKLVLLGGILGAYSLAHAAALGFQAKRLAGAAPYCIARNQTANGPPISYWAELRLSSFYTTKTNSTGSHTFAFHGVLIVDTKDGPRYFNWSPRRMRFDAINNPGFPLIPIRNACQPRSRFLTTLSLL